MENQKNDPYAAWRFPAFRAFMLGRIFFLMGTAAQGVAIGWEIYVRTDDPFSLGLVALAKGLPMILFTLPAGYIADAFDRRRVILICMTGATLTSLALAWFSWNKGSLLTMYALLFLDATCGRLGGPSGVALLPKLVPRDTFESAIKWRSNLFQFTHMLGPALGGFIIAWKLQAAYLLCAASSLIFIAMIVNLKIDSKATGTRGKPIQQIQEGIRFVWQRKLVLGAISLDMFAVLFGGAVYLLPVYARDIIVLNGMEPEQALGWLTAAPAVGALLMGVILAHSPPFKKAGHAMFLGVAGFGIVTIIFGLSTNFWICWIMLFLTGLFDNISVVVRHTLIQLATPDDMRGRVSAVNSIFIGSSNELGGFESGAVARLTNAVVSVVSGGIATLVIVGIWAGLFPNLRKFGRLSDVEEGKGI